MPTTWTKVTKATGTSWTKVPKASLTANVQAGEPIGLLLALTYSTTEDGNWNKVTKASGTAWTKISKAT